MGKVHGSLARAGKVRGQIPKVAKQDRRRSPMDAPTSACNTTANSSPSWLASARRGDPTHLRSRQSFF
ncbi:unnamed protein product [Prunus armeniaca]|uniref:40S ribosomal protein S30 n=1 Tax=Prunus armeniaca TaxID=36596 RepID=A0A6J5TVG3_PRUAR|nr:unnamed protein product [Prunus armeniaca]CAB4298183.1 unnamed protein product [Prunus armeniaca]